jgi:hypothetical protein
MKHYTVIARAPASAAFCHGNAIAMNYDIDGVPLYLEMTSRLIGPEGQSLGDLQVTARAQAESIEEAMKLVTRAREMALMVGIAANAHIAPFEGEIAYETTPGIEEREYFQRFMPADSLCYADRVIPCDAAAAVIEAMAHHPERDRIIRGMSQYALALSYWESGNELLALSHLFMGVEALKTAAWRQLLTRRECSRDELAAEWGHRPDGRIDIHTYLDREARIRLVFRNDQIHHQIAKEVSDSFEHGFANGGTLWSKASSTLRPTAEHLRHCILGMLNLPTDHLECLIGERYSHPRGPAGIDQYFYAKLLAPAGVNLSAEGHDHPFCLWEIEIDARRRKVDGTHQYVHNRKMTAIIGADVRLQPLNEKVFMRGSYSPKSAGELRNDNGSNT